MAAIEQASSFFFARASSLELSEDSRVALTKIFPDLEGMFGEGLSSPSTQLTAAMTARWQRLLSLDFSNELVEAERFSEAIEFPARVAAGEALVRAAVNACFRRTLFQRSSASKALADVIATVVKLLLLDAEAVAAATLAAGRAAIRADDELATDKLDTRVAETLTSAFDRLANGDLTYRISDQLPGEFAALRDGFNATAARLNEALVAVSHSARAIEAGSEEIAQASDDLSRRTETQAASLEQTAAALDQLTGSVRRAAADARSAAEIVVSARSEATSSCEVVRQAIEAMGGIEKSSQQISQIIGVIDEIAFQTNLLALNAGVEAARAGDAGRGFAVVASEVRALALRSANAAREIRDLIRSSAIQVGSGVTLVDKTGEALERIISRIAEIDALMTDIDRSAQEQAAGLAEVNTAVNQMDQTIQQNAAMVEEATAAVHSLKSEATSLSGWVSTFDLQDDARPRSRVAADQERIARAFASRGGPVALHKRI